MGNDGRQMLRLWTAGRLFGEREEKLGGQKGIVQPRMEGVCHGKIQSIGVDHLLSLSLSDRNRAWSSGKASWLV